MNESTAKDLRRASAALAMIAVANREAKLQRHQQLTPEARFRAVQAKTERNYRDLKARWKRLPHRSRGALRARLRQITARTMETVAA